MTDSETTETIEAIEDGMILDYITDQPIKEGPKEPVVQRTARALFHEYHIDIDDMVRDFVVTVEEANSKKKKIKIDIAIFSAGDEQIAENIKRVVVCEKQPKVGKKVPLMRSHEQAKPDLAKLESIMRALPQCDWGLWTNGVDFFYVQKTETRFDTEFNPVGDWPLGDDSFGTREVYSDAQFRVAKEDVLRITFRRCHNYIHGNEGMSKEVAF